jgi:glycine dehydrogenase subunit 1
MNYLSHNESERAEMLAAIGIADLRELFADVPEAVRFPELALPPGLSQVALERHMAEMAGANLDLSDVACFLGAGAYRHYIPPVVDALLSRGEFLTAYTPYQPEISQGTLTAIFEFQSLIASLTGMDLANASLYDGGSALAEATLMAARLTRRDGLVLAGSLHPAYRAVAATYAQGLALPMATIPSAADGRLDPAAVRASVGEGTACLAVGYPNFYGIIEDLEPLAEIVHAVGALLVVVVNPTALGLLTPPGALGADIVIGEGQPLGMPLSFGGPYLGLLATRMSHARQMPGRIIGEARDREGRRGYVMTLRAREQDIRREKATSNICTNQALTALAATIYLAALGETGFREVAVQCYHKAHYAHAALTRLPGVEPVFSGPFFHEFALRLPLSVCDLNDALLAESIVGPYDLGRDDPALAQCGLFCVTEMNTREEIDRLSAALEAIQ